MRALAPLPAFLLLAASAAACPFGYPGHTHASAARAAQAGAPERPLPAGRCGGGSPAAAAPQGGKPLDLRVHPIPADDMPAWQVLGYRAAGGRLLDTTGAPLTEEGLRFLESPWDAASEKLALAVWNSLMMDGYRLDERTCRVNGPDSKPITRVTVKYAKAIMVNGLAQISLERLLATIRTLPPEAPVPVKVRAMAQQMAAAGAPLPPEVRAVLDRPGATVAMLRGPATASYQGLQRFFDGMAPLGDTMGLAVPATGGAAARRSPYRNSAEQEFGRALQGAFRAELARNPVGADLLTRFDRDRRNGAPNLLVLKLNQRPEDTTQGAVYDQSHDTMIINHWTVADVVRRRTPPAKRASVEPLLSDPAKLMAFVTKDPELMKALIQEIDVEYFHELLHANQSRRTRIDDEAVRGNAPPANPIDKEREAHREHCRYLLSKASYDPAAVNASRWRNYCVGMLRDPDAFQDEVTRSYLSTFAGNATGPEFLQMQEVRRAAAAAPAPDWVQAGRQALRRLGLGYGDAAIADFNRDVRSRSAAFNAKIGAFRDHTAALMADGSRGAPDLALQYLALDPKWTASPKSAPIVASAERWVTANKTDPAKLADRLAVEDLASVWLRDHKKPASAELLAIIGKDYRAAAAGYVQTAKGLPRGPNREKAFDLAEAYAAAVHDQALVAQIRAERRKK